MTELFCEIGKHRWERLSQRGRPPRNCPEHQPIKNDVKITSSSAQISREKSKSVFDIVPGLKDLVQQDRMKTYHCEFGDGHDWQGESRRGRPPRFCPAHKELALKSSKSQPRVISQEKIEESKKKIEGAIQYHLSRVSAAEEVDNKAYQELQQIKNVTITKELGQEEKTFNNWLKKNSILLSEVLSLRLQETKLAALCK